MKKDTQTSWADSISPLSCWVSDALGKRDGDSCELFEGYEDTRIFEIKTNMGTHHVIGSIEGGGSIIDSFGDDTGYEFDDVQRWMRFSPTTGIRLKKREVHND